MYGGLRPVDGCTLTMTAPSRNSLHYQQFLHLVEQANPTGEIAVITDNLSSHNSRSTRQWLADHPRIRQVFIPKGACWLNLQEGWWRLFRRTVNRHGFRLCWRIQVAGRAWVSLASREVQLPVVTAPVSQASRRTRLMAMAVRVCCRKALGLPR